MIVGDWTNSGTTKIGVYREDSSGQDILLVSRIGNGDGTFRFHLGDVSSQTGLPGAPVRRCGVGQWKNNPT